MLRALILALVVVLQSIPLTVLAASPCRACDHEAVKSGVHCPLKKRAASAHRCHETAPANGDKLRSVGCTCGDNANAALRSGDPMMPWGALATGFLERVTSATFRVVPPLPDRKAAPPDPPPKRSILL